MKPPQKKLRIIDTGPTPFGAHRTEAVLRCPAYFAWSYIFGQEVEKISEDFIVVPTAPNVRPLPAFPLRRGTLGHVGLAHYYDAMTRGLDWQTRVTEALEAVDNACDQMVAAWGEMALHDHSGNSTLRQLVRSLIKGYASHYAFDDTYEPVGVEQLFEEVVTDPLTGEKHQFTQRIDLVFKDRAGRIWYADHKLVFRIDGRIPLRYTLSIQFLALQRWGLARHGDQFGGVQMNLLGCDAPFKFQREQPRPAPFRLARWDSDYSYGRRLEAQLRATYKKAEDFPGAINEQVCVTAYGPCPHFDTCCWGPSFLKVELEGF